jgi:hypothetical protein
MRWSKYFVAGVLSLHIAIVGWGLLPYATWSGGFNLVVHVQCDEGLPAMIACAPAVRGLRMGGRSARLSRFKTGTKNAISSFRCRENGYASRR